MISEYDHYWLEMQKSLRQLPHNKIQEMKKVIYNVAERDSKVWIIGNGGSASTAEHASCDLSKGLSAKSSSSRFQAFSLTSNSSLLTAWSNDTSYEKALNRLVSNFAEEGDVLLAISGSGNSANILSAIEIARAMGLFVVGLTGFYGGKMRKLLDLEIHIDSSDMQVVENMHLAVIHSMLKTCYFDTQT